MMTILKSAGGCTHCDREAMTIAQRSRFSAKSRRPNMKFADRSDAGRRLTGKLTHLKERQPVILALPRGVVAIGFEIAQALDAPLDVVLVRKIGVPWQPELAVGAVIDGATPETFIDPHLAATLDIPESYLQEETARQLAEIERRRRSTVQAVRNRKSAGARQSPLTTASPPERRCRWRCRPSGARVPPIWSSPYRWRRRTRSRRWVRWRTKRSTWRHRSVSGRSAFIIAISIN